MTRVCLRASRQGSIAIAATLSAWLGMLSVFHAESASGAQSTPNEAVPVESRDVRYVELQPSFITNVGVSDSGHLMYIRADISVRVS